MIARVIVDNRSKSVDKPFDYIIPDELDGEVGIGSRVIVPFSKSNTELEGFCIGVAESSEAKSLKKILSLAPQPKAFDEKMLGLIEWMRGKYLAGYIDIIRAVAPAGSAVKAEEWITLERPSELTGAAVKRIQEELSQNAGAMEISALEAVCGRSVRAQLRKMLSEGSVSRDFRISSAVGDKTRKYARLLIQPEAAAEESRILESRAPVQAKILDLLCRDESVSLSDLRRASNASKGSFDALVKKGLIEIFDAITERDPFGGREYDPTESPEPTYEQGLAIERINHAISGGTGGTFLLHGVTGSGKTEVFLQTIDRALSEGKSALVLVPEISLTPQMTERFYSRFGGRIALLHSARSMGERYDQWKRISDGGADIVIGARSAVFAPLKNIGVIIVDEEHSDTYKSEMLPRYHAREVALFRAEQYGAAAVLASATPSMESMYKARHGEYELITMRRRYNENEMPAVAIADMREELRNGNRTMFSRLLCREIEKNLKNREQTILFLNRRGFSTFVSCRSCGEAVKCPNCNISLTYHRFDDKLRCHYCGYEHRNYLACPACGSRYIRYFGGGTQRVEDETRKTFPAASVLRMDVDTTGKKQSHEKLIEKFVNEKTDILIGTQMVAKGLDFENVTLVGVISADTMLHINDYRSAERTFAMLEQVTGRAGRGAKKGRAVIQTYLPEAEAVSLVKTHDYDAFYESEAVRRSLMWYPPYSQIVCVLFSAGSEALAMRAARYYMKQLGAARDWGQKAQILGPVPASISKMNNKYRYRIIIKCEDCDALGERLLNAEKACRTHEIYKSVSVVTDKNPNMMY